MQIANCKLQIANFQFSIFNFQFFLGNAWLDWLQWVPAGLGLVLGLQGRGSTSHWILLSFIVPALRFLAASAYRQRVLGLLRRLWNSLKTYPLHRSHTPWAAAFIWVVLPAALTLLLKDYAIVSGDSRPAVLTAASLVTGGNGDLSTFIEVYVGFGLFTVDKHAPYFFQATKRGIYSSYSLGMVQFVLPVAAAARLAGADLTHPKVHDRLEKWTAAWVAAIALGLFFLLALHLAPLGPAYATTIMLATGSVMFTTVGQALWQHGGVILWALLALLVEFRHGDRQGLRGAVLQGIALGMMLACRLSSILFIVPFGVWVLLRSRPRAVALTTFSALAFAPWALLNQSIYGTILGPGTGQMAAGNWSSPTGSSLAAILISPGRGVLVYQPWILLAGLSLFPASRHNMTRFDHATCPTGWTGFCVGVILLHLMLISAWNCWWGGYCWGSRLAAEVIPLIALLCVRPIAALWVTANGRRLVMSLALISCLMHIPAIYLRSAGWNGWADVDHHPERLWSWSNPPFLYPLRHQTAARHYPIPLHHGYKSS